MELLKPLDSTIDAQIAEIKTLRTEIESGYLRIGAILDELQQAGYRMAEVYAAVGISHRSTRYLIRCHTLVRDLCIPKSRALDIGRSKLKAIAAPIQDDPKTLDYWLHAAETLNLRQLIAIRRGPRQTFTYTLTLTATEQVQLAAMLNTYGGYIRDERLCDMKAALFRLSKAVIADKVRYRVKARRTPRRTPHQDLVQ